MFTSVIVDVDLGHLEADEGLDRGGDRGADAVGDVVQRDRVLGDDDHVDGGLRLADLDGDALAPGRPG